MDLNNMHTLDGIDIGREAPFKVSDLEKLVEILKSKDVTEYSINEVSRRGFCFVADGKTFEFFWANGTIEIVTHQSIGCGAW